MTSADSPIEIIRPDYPRGGFQAALFDFDGTLSLLRGSWQEIMIEMMLDLLEPLPKAESRHELHPIVLDFVQKLTGEPTIAQMRQLVVEMQERGGNPLAAEHYKQQFLEVLDDAIARRLNDVSAGKQTLEQLMVPGAAELLGQLHQRNVQLWLASGTAHHSVVRELGVLGIDSWFDGRVFGDVPPPAVFSKGAVVKQMLREHQLSGSQIVGFGDGFVEIAEISRAGGLAIGVASDERTRTGIDAVKRKSLVEAGAHIIIGDYRCCEQLLPMIGL